MDETAAPHKRILYVITKAVWGGAQRYVYDLAIAAREAGHEIAVAYGEGGPLVGRLEETGIRTIQVESLSRDVRLRDELASFRALFALMRSENPDVVHVNSSKGGLALLAARVAGVPRIIFTAHGWAFNEDRSWWQKLLIRFAYVATIYLAQTTLCVSEAVRRDMAWVPFSKRKLVTVRLGIAPAPLLTRAKARKELAPESRAKTWIGMIAELHPSKRVEDAIRAMAELREGRPDLSLVVMGEGAHRTYLEALIAAYGLEERVMLAGFVPNAAAYLRAFDLFLMTSHTEALGYALLEAGAAELPVIGTMAGGIPEIIQHKRTGLLVPPRNPHVLARAIRTLLEEPQVAKELAAALTARVAMEFSQERMLRETLARY